MQRLFQNLGLKWMEIQFCTAPRGCLRFVIVVFPDQTLLLFLYIPHHGVYKQLQHSWFEEEIQLLGLNKEIATPMVLKKTSALYKGDPFLDNDWLLRVGGRLRLGELDFEIKPIILPRKSHVTNLIISHFHKA